MSEKDRKVSKIRYPKTIDLGKHQQEETKSQIIFLSNNDLAELQIEVVKEFFSKRAEEMDQQGKIINCCDICKKHLTANEGHVYPSITNLLCNRCYTLVFTLLNKDTILKIRYLELSKEK